MFFVRPLPFEEALNRLGDRSPIGSVLRSADWLGVPVGLRDRGFFSATVESIRFLQRAADELLDFLSGARAVNERGESYLKTGGRAQFIERMQEFAIREGMGPLDPEDAGTIRDIRSESRLRLIFDTQVKAAQDFGYWKQGMDPDVLDAFPAQRFIRVQDVKVPRDYHEEALGTVRLKSDLDYWMSLNRDFGVPHGPWGFNSGCDVEDVGREETEDRGLLKPGEEVRPVAGEFNDRLEASTRGLKPRLLRALETIFGDQAVIDGDAVRWRGRQLAAPSLPPAPAVPVPPIGAGLRTEPTRATAEEAELVNLPRERAVIYDGEGRLLFTQEAPTFDGRRVIFDDDQLAQLPGSVVSHNHPGGNAFSPADLLFAKDHDLAELRVLAPDYEGGAKLHRLLRPEGGWTLHRDRLLDLAGEFGPVADERAAHWAHERGLPAAAAQARALEEFWRLLQDREEPLIYEAHRL
jgi:hypothetical protein